MEVRGAAVDLEHFGRDPVEDVPVVGHEQQTTRKHGQPFFEEGDRVEVEVVGRLVEDQRIPLAREQRRERDAFALPARELIRRGFEHVAHAQAGEHRLALPLLTIETGAYCGANRAVGQYRKLGQRADPGVAATAHDAGVGLAVAAHHREQRALPAPVQPDDTDPVAVAERQRKIGEQGPIRAGRAQSLGIDQDHVSGYGPSRRAPVPAGPAPSQTSRGVARAFGVGPHFCLGAHLARLETAEMLRHLLRRAPEMTIGDPTRVGSNFVNGIARLPVENAGQ